MRLSATLRPVTRLTGSLGVATITSFGDATALVTDILAPKTAYIATGKVTGTCTFDADTSDATAAESDILLGKTAYADGEKKTGTSTLNADTTDATLTANDMLYGVTGYGADGTKLTGAGAYWQYATGGSFNAQGNDAAVLPAGVFNLYAPNVIITSNMFNKQTQITSINMNIASTTPSFIYTFNGCTALQHIYSTLNFTSVSNSANCFTGCGNLITVSFTPSSIKTNHVMSACPLLSTASLLSIANGLNAATHATLTMHATSITNCNNIMVNVTGGVATIGTTKTLTAFITDDKTWSIA